MHKRWLPLAERLTTLHWEAPQRTLLIGINGAQGCGKSTMSAALAYLLERVFGLQTLVLSIDDLYLTRAERISLAESVHPLLATRGVPGTHDIALGMRLIEALKAADQTTDVAIPRFDKAADDRLPEVRWPLHRGRPDLILLEGWCVGTPPQTDAELVAPVNTLERDEDGNGVWRAYVNRALTGEYRDLFSALDYLIMLRAPDFETVYRWRGKQEDALRASQPAGAFVMDEAQLARFISHYERLTRHALAHLPRFADLIYEFDDRHQVVRADHRSGRL